MEINLQDTTQLLKGIAIPPRPAILDDVKKEAAKDDPNFGKIAQRIGQDVGLAAAMLKTVNSPLFGLSKRVSSVQQAVQLLGIKNTVNIVTGLVLKTSLSGNNAAQLDLFWDNAALEAMVSAFIASQVPGAQPDTAYTFGLFHNCGIPLLMQRFPDYGQTLLEAASQPELSITAVEEKRHATCHTAVGYLMARSWFMPEPLCQTILCHHDASVFAADNQGVAPETCTLIAITQLADHIAHHLARPGPDHEWERMGRQSLSYLGLNDDDYDDIHERVHQLMSQS